MKKVFWPTITVVWIFTFSALAQEAMGSPDSFCKILMGLLAFLGVQIYIIKQAIKMYD